MVNKIQETNAAAKEVENLRSETSEFLTPADDDSIRTRRSSDAVGASVLAGIGLFGPGIFMNALKCGVSGIFGVCQDYGRENAENIDRISEFTSVLTDHVLQFKKESNKKFYMISDELKEITKIQMELAENQNKNWKEQFEIFERNILILSNCEQLLFSNQQLNFNFDTVASLLSVIYADIKSYRWALYAYKVNILNSIPILLGKRLPMSLVPKDSLNAILHSVHDSHKHARDRLSLAIPMIPMADLLSYYDAQLLTGVINRARSTPDIVDTLSIESDCI